MEQQPDIWFSVFGRGGREVGKAIKNAAEATARPFVETFLRVLRERLTPFMVENEEIHLVCHLTMSGAKVTRHWMSVVVGERGKFAATIAEVDLIEKKLGFQQGRAHESLHPRSDTADFRLALMRAIKELLQC